MDWKESINRLQARDGNWSAYITQEDRGCGWRVFHQGMVVGAGYSDTIEMAKQKVEDTIESNRE